MSPVTHPFPKATCVCSVPIVLPVTHPFPRPAWQRPQWHAIYGPSLFQTHSHCSILASTPQVFLKDWCCHKTQPIWFNGWQLSIYHFLVLFCFVAFYMLQNKYDSTNIKSSYHKSFHIQERRKKIGTNLYKNDYIAVKKLEMRRPFAFSFFWIWVWFSINSEFNRIGRCLCSSPFVIFFIQNLDSALFNQTSRVKIVSFLTLLIG